MIAGLENITAGEIRIGERVVNHVPPKERAEVTGVRAPDTGTDLDEGQVGLGQQLLGVLDPAQAHVLVRRQPGGVLEQVRKMGGAHLRHSGERRQADLLL